MQAEGGLDAPLRDLPKDTRASCGRNSEKHLVAPQSATAVCSEAAMSRRFMKQRPEALPEIKTALARQIARRLGDQPVRCALRAHVFTAHRRGPGAV